MFVARLAVELGVLLLIATALNVPLGVSLLRGWDCAVRSYPIVLLGSDAAAHGWPWRTPSTHPSWPAPTSVSIVRLWGYSAFDARKTENDPSYSMSVQRAGWPLRVVAEPRYWYPDSLNRPGVTRADPMPGVQLDWLGLALNPPIVAVSTWALLIAPIEAFFALRWRRRLNRRLCPYCAYPAGRADVCTECGRAAVA